MNARSFRKNHSLKSKSTSSTFISLHFNKADEDQLEISYKEDKSFNEDSVTRDNPEALQNDLTIYDDQNTKRNSETFKFYGIDNESLSRNDSVANPPKTTLASSLAEAHFDEEKPTRTVLSTKNDKNEKCDRLDSNLAHIKESLHKEGDETTVKLRSFNETAKLEEKDSFNHHISDTFENKTLVSEKEALSCTLSQEPLSSSETVVRSSKILTDHSTSITDESYTFHSIIQKSIDFLNYAKNSVKFHILVALCACLFAPVPSWLSGFLVGTILSSSLVYWLYKPTASKKNFREFNFSLPKNTGMSDFQDDSGILKGWMNELPSSMNYSPDNYHVSCTRSIYVRLDGSYLRFSFPQKNIPKRAMFNEPRYDMQFIYQQHYDIAEATVELLPKEIANKRLWSKKYPICLRIPNSKEAVLSNTYKADILEGPFLAKSNKKENASKKFVPRINENNEIVIYLFSRTDREKNVWYYRFKKAAKREVIRGDSPTVFARIKETDSSLENKRTLSVDFAFLQLHSPVKNEEPIDDEVDGNFVELSFNRQQRFEMYMSTLFAPLHGDNLLLPKKEKNSDKKKSKVGSGSSNLTWLNVLIGRIFFDFLVQDEWAKLVSEKIQKKLNKIKLPFFLTELIVKDIHLGSALPKIHQASDPSVDEKGLWMDIDLSYNGSFHMTLETKLSLRRQKGDSGEFWTLSEVIKENEVTEQPTKPQADSDEDSLESSSDEEVYNSDLSEESSLKESQVPSSCGSTSRKFLKFVDRLTQSPYFQHAANNKYIKKAMEDLSNTPLVLTVEVQWLTGTLAINIPPWPTDRLWYGFRTNPSLSITARPKLGQHVVTLTHVTEWIEKKLVAEFQKLLVMPNMDDLIIPIMCSSVASTED